MSDTQRNDTFISKLIIEERTIYIKVLWKQNDKELFQIHIYDTDSSWSGSMSLESAQEYRDEVYEGEEEYNNKVKTFLKGQDKTCLYDFIVTDNSDEATLYWKVQFEDAVQGHGSVLVHRDKPSLSKDNLIDYLLSEHEVLKALVNDSDEKNAKLKSELAEYTKELEKFTEIKSSLETNLYGKFVQILNTKKRRIQLLEENLKELE